ncbi:PREDICTED: UPF0389 protein CG9231 [Papilio polytes]|uniref:UPF0389 protein CG9231 n=1 Tax=Papilio polytes TaxID=76194 RepID=UPI000675E3DD|nr:PREDICTED: UPF0389 protein CG9231 [Papilio polytes]
MNKLLINRAQMLLLTRGMCVPAGATGTTSAPKKEDRMMSRKFRPSNFQKTILVWTKKFKSKEEIPTFVSAEVIDRARSEARIKISNVLMVLTALASLGAVLAGKSAAKRGESVHQMNLDWHKKYNDEQSAKAEVGKPTN